MIQSDLYDSSDAYIVFKGTITVTDPNNNANNACDKEIAFKNNASFISCISKINNTLIGHESITGKLENNNVEKKGLEIVVSLKYLINFQRTLDMELTNRKASLALAQSESCVITSQATKEADLDADPAIARINNPSNATFEVKDTKLYGTVVTLSTQDNKFSKQLKTRFRRTIEWNKYRSKMPNQT